MKIIEKNIHAVDTPRVLVDYDLLLANIHMIHGYARQHLVDVRPHVKSHKCLDIAKLQTEEGITGFTAAKVDEAGVFFGMPVRSFTIAYPLIGQNKIQRILSSTRQFNLDMNLIADSEEGYNAISVMCERLKVRINLFIKIDVGLNRCGLLPEDPRILHIAKNATAHEQIEFAGLLSHAGHVYKALNIQNVIDIAQDELKQLFRVRKLLLEYGIETRKISIGATPALLTGIDLKGVSEIRPGNYVFLDRITWKLGLIAPEQIALTIMATLVSKNKRYFIIDAGSKVISSDTGAHGSSLLDGFGLAYPSERFLEEKYKMKIAALSEEHGFITHPGFELSLGTKIRIIPNHACPVVNLTDSMAVHSKNIIINVWKVHARGKVL